jgi:hypothetical protein
MIEVTVGIRALLAEDTELMSILGGIDQIYPAHSSNYTDIIYPCVTISQPAGGDGAFDFTKDTTKQIDVYSMVDSDELWAIYRRIEATINKKSLPNMVTFTMREVPGSVRDDLYEKELGVHHLTSRYKVLTLKK